MARNVRRANANAPGGSMGDVFEALQDEGHLTPRRSRAAVAFLAELQAAHGSSAGLVGQTTERVQMGATERIWPVGGPRGIEQLDARLNRLRHHERKLMAWLIKHRELNRGSLADFGRADSGYRTVKTARAYTAGRINALLDTLADEYLGPESV